MELCPWYLQAVQNTCKSDSSPPDKQTTWFQKSLATFKTNYTSWKNAWLCKTWIKSGWLKCIWYSWLGLMNKTHFRCLALEIGAEGQIIHKLASHSLRSEPSLCLAALTLHSPYAHTPSLPKSCQSILDCTQWPGIHSPASSYSTPCRRKFLISVQDSL